MFGLSQLGVIFELLMLVTIVLTLVYLTNYCNQNVIYRARDVLYASMCAAYTARNYSISVLYVFLIESLFEYSYLEMTVRVRT